MSTLYVNFESFEARTQKRLWLKKQISTLHVIENNKLSVS